MKLTQITLAVAALLSTAAAQGLGDLPNCAKSCATNAIPEKCGIDVACICENKSFLSSIACCVADKCSKEDQETTLKAAKSICARGGVNDLPNTVACSSDATSSTSSSTSTTSGSATAKTTDATTTATGTRTSSNESSSSSAAASSASATGAAAPGQNKDASFMAAAGAAAALAIFV